MIEIAFDTHMKREELQRALGICAHLQDKQLKANLIAFQNNHKCCCLQLPNGSVRTALTQAAFVVRFLRGNSSRSRVRPRRHGTAPITMLSIWASIATPWHADVTAFGTLLAVALVSSSLADEPAVDKILAGLLDNDDEEAAIGREQTRASAS